MQADDPADPPFDEAEKVPKGEYRTYFIDPPETTNRRIQRSAIVSGSLGAGKTMLLRTIQEERSRTGLAIKVNLVSTLLDRVSPTTAMALADQRGRPTDVGRLVQRKVVALIALRIAVKACKEGVPLPESLNAMMPADEQIQLVIQTPDRLRLRQAQLEETPVDAFSKLGAPDTLLRVYVTELAENAIASRGRLSLYFDRAEFFTPVELNPVMSLLAKSEQYSALVSMRPGTRTAPHDSSEIRVYAGDDYDLIHLGTLPRRDDYNEFVRDLLVRQSPTILDGLEPDAWLLIRQLARESLRHTIQFVVAYSHGKRRGEAAAMSALTQAVDAERRQLASAIRGNMRLFHPDFIGVLRSAIRRADEVDRAWEGPVTFTPNYEVAGSPSLSGDSQFEQMINHALRHGALVLAEGELWNPQNPPTELEINPLLLWDGRTDPWPSPARSYNFSETERQFTKMVLPKRKIYRIFLAYNFSRPASARLHTELLESMELVGGTDRYEIVTGKGIPPGSGWAAEIRKRIERCKCAIVDVSNLNKDVLYESGLVVGRRLPMVPVVENLNSGLAAVPDWLRRAQIVAYAQQSELAIVVDEAVTVARESSRAQKPWPKLPDDFVSSSAVVISGSPFSDTQAGLALKKALIEREFRAQWFSLPDETTVADELDAVLEAAGKAGLIVFVFPGTTSDWVFNFIAGYVLARPGASPKRRLLISTEDEDSGEMDGVAAALLAYKSHVRRSTPARLASAVGTYRSDLLKLADKNA